MSYPPSGNPGFSRSLQCGNRGPDAQRPGDSPASPTRQQARSGHSAGSGPSGLENVRTAGIRLELMPPGSQQTEPSTPASTSFQFHETVNHLRASMPTDDAPPESLFSIEDFLTLGCLQDLQEAEKADGPVSRIDLTPSPEVDNLCRSYQSAPSPSTQPGKRPAEAEEQRASCRPFRQAQVPLQVPAGSVIDLTQPEQAACLFPSEVPTGTYGVWSQPLMQAQMPLQILPVPSSTGTRVNEEGYLQFLKSLAVTNTESSLMDLARQKPASLEKALLKLRSGGDETGCRQLAAGIVIGAILNTRFTITRHHLVAKAVKDFAPDALPEAFRQHLRSVDAHERHIDASLLAVWRKMKGAF